MPFFIKKFGTYGLVLLSVLVWVSAGRSGTFEIEIKVSVPDSAADNGLATNRLIAGGHHDATSGFDGLFDVPALFYDDTLKASFPHPELPREKSFLWRDIRRDEAQLSWAFEISSNKDQTPVTLQWFSRVGSEGCEGVRFKLTDETSGQVIDMGLATNYSYTNESNLKRRFLLQAEETETGPPHDPVKLWSPRQGKGGVLLSWSMVVPGEEVGFRVYRRKNDGPFVEILSTPLDSRKFLDRGIERHSMYTYKITAVSPNGCESQSSNELSVNIP